MGIRKFALVFMLSLSSLFGWAVSSLASTPESAQWIHGNYNSTTVACASCHLTHAAEVPGLIKQGPTQTQLCYLCHGQGSPGSAYDSQSGRTLGSVSGQPVWYPSTAGGFEGQMVPDLGLDYSVTGSTIQPVTSRHNVWGYTNETGSVDSNDPGGDLFIPGGQSALTGLGLECSSCHDPHGGGNIFVSGQYKTRLLRTSFFGQTVTPIQFLVTNIGTHTNELEADRAVPIYQVTGYSTASPTWCGACHNKFNTNGSLGYRIPGQGHATNYLGGWRHPMDVHAVLPPGADGSIKSGTPLGQNSSITTARVGCLTCHRAHSTAATMGGEAANWIRSEGGTGSSSALLRMNNRGVCYNCHRSAQYNSWSDSRTSCANCHPDADGLSGHNSPGTTACSYCHSIH